VFIYNNTQRFSGYANALTSNRRNLQIFLMFVQFGIRLNNDIANRSKKEVFFGPFL
jgi:hypothetical protein